MVVALTIDTRTETRWRIDNARSYPTKPPADHIRCGASGPLAHVRVFAAAQHWTPQQRAACEPDAMRLCQQYISDIGRVRSCMSHYRRYLSPACRAVFQGGAKKSVRRFRR
jgi:hypothetical protein